MEKDLVQSSCADFAAVLAAKQAVPGGGGAAAYVGALSAALCSMVGNYTSGKRTYAEVEDDIVRMLQEAETVRLRLLELVDEDARSFMPLSKAYAIPRDDARRAEILEKATKDACSAPLEMVRQIAKSVELLEEMGKKGSKMLASDVGCGALLARAALESAAMNVFVNTRTLKDVEFARSVEAEIDDILDTYVPRAQRCADAVMHDIRGKG